MLRVYLREQLEKRLFAGLGDGTSGFAVSNNSAFCFVVVETFARCFLGVSSHDRSKFICFWSVAVSRKLCLV